MTTYIATLKHDTGRTRIKIQADSERQAIQRITATEHCPERAIKLKPVPGYKIVSHGEEQPDYFRGVTALFTAFEKVVTGTGYDEKDAYNDAADQICEIEDNPPKLPTNPRGIRADRTASEGMYYVSIFYTPKP